MNTNIITASFDGPRHSFLLMDTDEPGLATSNQKRVIYRLLCENMQDGESRELHINQIPYITQNEANDWIEELKNSIW